jgi:hypothetical protein
MPEIDAPNDETREAAAQWLDHVGEQNPLTGQTFYIEDIFVCLRREFGPRVANSVKIRVWYH